MRLEKKNNMSKKIVLSGYYGFGNTGDESVLAGIISTLGSIGIDAEITVLSADPQQTMKLHPTVSAIHRYRIFDVVKAIANSNLLISGGGSLLQDVTSARSLYYYLFIIKLAQIMGKKTMIYAQGIGPLNRNSAKKAVACVLNKVNAITVRDDDSKTLLQSIGVSKPQIIQSADPSLLLQADVISADKTLLKHGLDEEEFIAITLRPWQNSNEWMAKLKEGIKSACSEIGVEPILIAMQESEDREISVDSNCGAVLEPGLSLQCIKGIIARSSLVVGMRLHSLIFAAGVCVPFLPIIYDPKVASFSTLAGQKDILDIESLSTDEVKSKIIHAWNNRKERTENLKKVCDELSSLAKQSGFIAESLLKEL